MGLAFKVKAHGHSSAKRASGDGNGIYLMGTTSGDKVTVRVIVQATNAEFGYIGAQSGLPAGTPFKFRTDTFDARTDTVIIEVQDAPRPPAPTYTCFDTSKKTGVPMQGNVYEGVVIKTTTVPAGEGLAMGVQKSEIVLKVEAFICKSAEDAKAIVLAKAIAEGHAIDDPVVVVEAKVRTYVS